MASQVLYQEVVSDFPCRFVVSMLAKHFPLAVHALRKRRPLQENGLPFSRDHGSFTSACGSSSGPKNLIRASTSMLDTMSLQLPNPSSRRPHWMEPPPGSYFPKTSARLLSPPVIPLEIGTRAWVDKVAAEEGQARASPC